MVFHFQHHRAVSELCDCRYLCSTAWFSGISLSWGQVSRRNPAFRIPYVSILLSSRQKVIPKTSSEGCMFFLCSLSCSSVSGWCVCVCCLSLTQDSSLSKPSFCLQQQWILSLGRGSCLQWCLSCFQTASALAFWFLMVWRGWKWEEGAEIFAILTRQQW